MRGKWIVGIVLALCLSGCAAEVPDESPGSSAPGASTPWADQVEQAPAEEVSVEQDEAIAPASEPPGSPIEMVPGESEFLQAVGTAWHGDVPDAQVLLDLGIEACALLRAGTQISDVQVVSEGSEFKDANNDTVRLAALHMLCPDLVSP